MVPRALTMAPCALTSAPARCLNVVRALPSVRSRSAKSLRKLSPICSKGILLTLLMMLVTFASVASSSPGMVGSCTGCLRPIHPHRRCAREKVESYVYGSGQQTPGTQLRPHAVGNQLSIIFLRSGSRSAPGPVQILYAKSLADPAGLSPAAENWNVFKSICARISMTSPIVMPRNSTGAPGASPRTDL